MLAILITLLVLLSGYGAYRAFRGGFQRPQSEKLTGYGIIGIGVILLVSCTGGRDEGSSHRHGVGRRRIRQPPRSRLLRAGALDCLACAWRRVLALAA